MHANMRLLLVIFIAFLVSCSNKNDDNISEIELYKIAQKNLNSGNYTNAITNLKKLETRYPFGRFAEQAQLELMYAYFKTFDLDKLKATSERFMRLYPQSSNLDYVYYVRAIAAFERDRSFFARYFPLDMSKRDPGAARDAFVEFAELTRRFPQSRFAPDAKQRMIYLRNLLADYEVHVARYYLKRGAYVAAVNRGQYVVQNFQGTPAVKDALIVLNDAYTKLKLPELAKNSLDVMRLNYPN